MLGNVCSNNLLQEGDKKLLSTNGRAGKAMRVGEKHHVALCFPILNPVGKDFCMLVDCCCLPSVVHNIDPLKVNSNQDYVGRKR